ncbi:MAG TPA: energy transducer TonB [Longimicrobiales bacterium]|nr:energy transducer TonB [Longimicrobiales bacterium]
MLGVGMFAAIALEVGLLLAGPRFRVPVDFRLIVVADTLKSISWSGAAADVNALPSPTIAPRITNLDALQLALPRTYPPVPWRIRLENAVTLRLRIDHTGAVTDVRLVEPGSDMGADEALARLAMLLRFRPARIDGRNVPVTGFLRLAVEIPLKARARGWVDRVN